MNDQEIIRERCLAVLAAHPNYIDTLLEVAKYKTISHDYEDCPQDEGCENCRDPDVEYESHDRLSNSVLVELWKKVKNYTESDSDGDDSGDEETPVSFASVLHLTPSPHFKPEVELNPVGTFTSGASQVVPKNCMASLEECEQECRVPVDDEEEVPEDAVCGFEVTYKDFVGVLYCARPAIVAGNAGVWSCSQHKTRNSVLKKVF